MSLSALGNLWGVQTLAKSFGSEVEENSFLIAYSLSWGDPQLAVLRRTDASLSLASLQVLKSLQKCHRIPGSWHVPEGHDALRERTGELGS